MTPADRLAALARLGLPADVPTDHLLVARNGGRVVGAAFAQLAAGRLAEVLPPAADDPATADALAVELVARLRSAGVAIAQCLTDTPEPAAPLVTAGFRPVTRLLTLERSFVGWAESSRPTSGVRAADVGLEDSAHPTKETAVELIDTFAATLAGSLDLPELAGVRPPAAELAGYPAAGRFLARLGGVAVGVLFLAPGEVLYLGLVPAARGRGYGDALLSHALLELAGRVTVSADERNRPALRLYDRHGFRLCRSQCVFLWTPPG